MQNVLEVPPGAFIAKRDLAHPLPIEASVSVDHGRSEALFDLLDGGLVGAGQFSRDFVSVDDLNAVCSEQIRDSGFPGADAAGQTDGKHGASTKQTKVDGINLRTPNHGDDAGCGEIGAERQGCAAIVSTQGNKCYSDNGANQG